MINDDLEIPCARSSGVYMSFTDQTVIKKQDSLHAHQEYQKSILGNRLGNETGLFRVPEILDYQPDSGVIVFERIYGLRTLAEALSLSKMPEELIKKVAYALATIHNSDPVQEAKGSILDYGGIKSAESMFLHGDFSIKNIHVDDTGNLVILDWSTAVWVGGDGDETGPCYLDLSIFILSLFFHRPFEAHRFKRPGDLVPILLDSYCSKYSGEFDVSELKLFFPQLVKIFLGAPRKFRSKLRVLACYPTVLAVKKCVRNL